MKGESGQRPNEHPVNMEGGRGGGSPAVPSATTTGKHLPKGMTTATENLKPGQLDTAIRFPEEDVLRQR